MFRIQNYHINSEHLEYNVDYFWNIYGEKNDQYIFQNFLFCVKWKKESHTGLENDMMNYSTTVFETEQ